MYIAGMILLFAAGYLAVFNISTETTRLERLGLAFPAGVGVVTFVMALMDLAGMPLSPPALLAAAAIVTAVLAALLLATKRGKALEALRRPADAGSFNLVWLLLLAFAVWLEYANFRKCIYFPVYDTDSLNAFDTMGFVAAQEHTYGGMSLFDGGYVPKMHGPGSPMVYFPLLQLSYAYVYALGAETSKAVPAFMFLSFLVAFYAAVRRSASPTAAMAATLLVLMTPEMTAFSSLSGTNVVQAAYASLGVIYVLAWIESREAKYVRIGSLLLACNLWSRAEGIVFIAAAGLAVLCACVRKKDFRPLLPVVLALAPAAVWMIYTRRFGMTAESFVITHPFFDGEKASAIARGAAALLTNTQYYGWTFPALGLAVLADAYFMARRRADIAKLAVFAAALVFYFVLLYQIDYKWDSVDNVLAYSAKRYMFCFVPIAWHFVATCTPVTAAMRKFDAFMGRRA